MPRLGTITSELRGMVAAPSGLLLAREPHEHNSSLMALRIRKGSISRKARVHVVGYSAATNGHIRGDGFVDVPGGPSAEVDGVAGDPKLEPTTSTLRRLGTPILLVAVLVGLVALGSRPRDSSSAQLAGTGMGVLVVQVIASILILASLAGLGFIVASWSARRRKRKDDEYRHYVEPIRIHWAVKLVLIALPLALIGGLILALILSGGGQSQPPEIAVGPLGARPPSEGGEAHATPTSLPFLWVFAGVVVLATAAILVWGLRQRVHRVASESSEQDAFARVIDDGLNALERETDPRRAVVLAYYAMERALARHGLARKDPEAPVEYMLRVLTDLPNCTGAVRRLTELFEEAKFSHHSIVQSSRTSAVEALLSVREALQAAA